LIGYAVYKQELFASTYFFQEKHTHNWGFVVPVIAVLIGVGYIILHFGNWAGFNNYFSYMESKFAGRTVGAKGLQLSSYINHNLNILVFYALGAGSILLLFFVGLFNKTNSILGIAHVFNSNFTPCFILGIFK
jgi:hypothetical protein